MTRVPPGQRLGRARQQLVALLLSGALLFDLSSAAAAAQQRAGTCAWPTGAEEAKCNGDAPGVCPAPWSARATCAASPAAARRASSAAAQPPSQGSKWIVRFKSYRHAQEHHAALSAVLPGEGRSWRWLDRHNRAAAYPTDFALVQLEEEGQRGTLLAALSTVSGVRDVHPDKQFTGKLQWEPEGELKQLILDATDLMSGGDGAAGRVARVERPASTQATQQQQQQQQQDGSNSQYQEQQQRQQQQAQEEHEVDLHVEKPPGRFSTRFMMEGGGYEDDEEEEQLQHQQHQQADAAHMRHVEGGGEQQQGEEGEELVGNNDRHLLSSGSGLALRARHRTAAAAQQMAAHGSGLDGGGDGDDGSSSGGGVHRHGSRVTLDYHPHHHHLGEHHGSASFAAPVSPSQRLRHGSAHSTQRRASGRGQQGGDMAEEHQQQPHLGRGQQHWSEEEAGSSGAVASEATAGQQQVRQHHLRQQGGGGGVEGAGSQKRRKLSGLGRSSITSMLGADEIWRQGFTGAGVKVGVFDTGIRPNHPHMRHIRERTNWTHQNSLADGLGHGTFVAGVIGSQEPACPGLAPDVELYTFKVFTDDQVSFTSWFLDAFNYAILSGVHVINLSIGGPDFLDQPFVDKVWEVTSSGILLVSAIGNDGPLYGTLNNPADQNDVIGVGGIDDYNAISGFSSRGMTSWELPVGSGRIKPDIMAFSKDVQGSKIQTGCRSLSGTSVASPVVAGAVCLLASTVPEAQRWAVLNPASMKQALIEGSERLNNLNLYEQGSGKLNLHKSMAILKGYQPRASVVPSQLDLTDAPYMWPYSRQPLYATALPLVFNATVLNAMGVTGTFKEPPRFYALDEGGDLLHVSFEYSEVLWPWSGYLALFIRVRDAGRDFTGTATGKVVFTIVSPPAPGETAERTSTVVMPIKAAIQPPPPRHKRVLWDQFHSIKYPPGYIPRDNLDIKHDILDWHGDHLFTNYHGLYNALKDRDYYVEVLSSPATCFNASHYGTYLIVDPEDEFYKEEVAKLERDVKQLGLNLVVFAEWYHVDSMLQMKFFDDNTRSWWSPVTGGANVPALNDLLLPFGMQLGDSIIHGHVTSPTGMQVQVQFGVDIALMPEGSYLYVAPLNAMSSKSKSGQYGFLGITPAGEAGGHVAVFADSNCLDSSHQTTQCYEMLHSLLTKVNSGKIDGMLGGTSDQKVGPGGWRKDPYVLPQRRKDINFSDYSFVLSHPLKCYSSGFCSSSPEVPATSSSCQDFLDRTARSTRLSKALLSSTSVSINYSSAGGGAAAGQQQPSATRTTASSNDPGAAAGAGTAAGGGLFATGNGTLHSTVMNALRGATFGMGASFLYLASIICVFGLMVVVGIWQFRGATSGKGPGTSRQDKARSRVAVP